MDPVPCIVALSNQYSGTKKDRSGGDIIFASAQGLSELGSFQEAAAKFLEAAVWFSENGFAADSDKAKDEARIAREKAGKAEKLKEQRDADIKNATRLYSEGTAALSRSALAEAETSFLESRKRYLAACDEDGAAKAAAGLEEVRRLQQVSSEGQEESVKRAMELAGEAEVAFRAKRFGEAVSKYLDAEGRLREAGDARAQKISEKKMEAEAALAKADARAATARKAIELQNNAEALMGQGGTDLQPLSSDTPRTRVLGAPFLATIVKWCINLLFLCVQGNTQKRWQC